MAGEIALAVALGLGAAGRGSAAASSRPSNTPAACSAPSAVPIGMNVLTTARLPAQALATLRLIAARGPYPYAHGNTIFGNYGGALPHERYRYCREFTVQTRSSALAGAAAKDRATENATLSAARSTAAIGPRPTPKNLQTQRRKAAARGGW
jgi:ribonuclease T1